MIFLQTKLTDITIEQLADIGLSLTIGYILGMVLVFLLIQLYIRRTKK